MIFKPEYKFNWIFMQAIYVSLGLQIIYLQDMQMSFKYLIFYCVNMY